MVYEEADRIVKAFEENDMAEIGDILFSNRESEFDEQLVRQYGFADKEDEDSILSKLFLKVSLKIKKINSNEITYTVAAPDMAEFFLKNQSDMAVMDQDGLKDYFTEYMDSVPLKERQVKVEYRIDDGKFAANYKSKDFINAVTGGLLESYIKLYEQMLKEYKDNVKEGETH